MPLRRGKIIKVHCNWYMKSQMTSPLRKSLIYPSQSYPEQGLECFSLVRKFSSNRLCKVLRAKPRNYPSLVALSLSKTIKIVPCYRLGARPTLWGMRNYLSELNGKKIRKRKQRDLKQDSRKVDQRP